MCVCVHVCEYVYDGVEIVCFCVYVCLSAGAC